MSGRRDALAPAVAFVLPLAAYVATLAPSVADGDSGELSAAAWCLGVPHPTGFPLWCLLGRLACFAPLGDVAWRTNLLSALATSLAALLLCLTLRTGGAGRTAALAGALAYAFSATAWSQAVVARVYPLAAALLFAELLLAARLRERFQPRDLLLLDGAFALGLATHLLGLAGAPLVLYGHLRARRSGAPASVHGRALAALLLAPLLYAYVPLRALAEPPVCWGQPTSAAGLYDYFTQRDYAAKQLARSPGNLSALLAIVGGAALTDLGPVLPLVGLAGLGLLGRRSPDAVGWALAPAAVALAVVLSYGDDKDLPFAPLYLWSFQGALALGVGCALEALGRRRQALAALAAVALVGHEAVVNVRVAGRSDLFVREVAAATLATPPGRALCFLAGDTSLFSARYLQVVEALRPDLAVLGSAAWRADLAFAAPVFLNFVPAELPPGTALDQAGLLYRLRSAAEPPEPPERSLDRFAGYDLRRLLAAPLPYPEYKAAALCSDVFFKWGQALAAAGRTDEALARFGQAARAAPLNPLVQYNLARVLAAPPFDRRDLALERLRQGLLVDPSLAGDPARRLARVRGLGFPDACAW